MKIDTTKLTVAQKKKALKALEEEITHGNGFKNIPTKTIKSLKSRYAKAYNNATFVFNIPVVTEISVYVEWFNNQNNTPGFNLEIEPAFSNARINNAIKNDKLVQKKIEDYKNKIRSLDKDIKDIAKKYDVPVDNLWDHICE
jgi:predicted  nucleic acid-binding Zn-ribbon protein